MNQPQESPGSSFLQSVQTLSKLHPNKNSAVQKHKENTGAEGKVFSESHALGKDIFPRTRFSHRNYGMTFPGLCWAGIQTPKKWNFSALVLNQKCWNAFGSSPPEAGLNPEGFGKVLSGKILSRIPRLMNQRENWNPGEVRRKFSKQPGIFCSGNLDAAAVEWIHPVLSSFPSPRSRIFLLTPGHPGAHGRIIPCLHAGIWQGQQPGRNYLWKSAENIRTSLSQLPNPEAAELQGLSLGSDSLARSQPEDPSWVFQPLLAPPPDS